MSAKSKSYEEHFTLLEKITESLNKDEIRIDDLVEKTREALNAARVCMEILQKQKGEFRQLENEFAQLLDEGDKAPEAGEAGAAPSDESEPF